jgi:hypothetical protein
MNHCVDFFSTHYCRSKYMQIIDYSTISQQSGTFCAERERECV